MGAVSEQLGVWMRGAVIALIFMLLTPLVMAAPDGGMLLDEHAWQSLRNQPARYADLLRRCEAALERAPQPVAELVLTPHYPEAGRASPPNKAGKQLADDSQIAYRAGLCYQLTGDGRFARHAQQMLDAWGTTLRAVDSRQGAASVNFYLPAFIIAGYWVRDFGDWDERDWQAFLRQTVAPLSAAHRHNNHGSWGVLLNATLAVYLQDAALLAQTQLRWQALVAAQVDAEGVMTQEICRSDTANWCGGATKGIKGIAYTHFALLPTALSAQILGEQGHDVWYTPAGASLGKAYAKAAQWTLHPETFPFYRTNHGRLIGVENGDYFALLQRHYPNPDGAAVLAKGGQGMSRFHLSLLFPSE